MDDALRGEMLHHAPGSQLVVVRAGEQAGDGAEGFNEAGKIGEPVERLGLGEGQRLSIVAHAELDQRRGQNGAFEMQMQLGLGQAADEFADFSHNFKSQILYWVMPALRPAVSGCGKCAADGFVPVLFELNRKACLGNDAVKSVESAGDQRHLGGHAGGDEALSVIDIFRGKEVD